MGSVYTPFKLLFPINEHELPYGPDGIEYPFEFDLTWMYYAACVIAFLCAMGIGMNDVANAFATSVGAKSLKFWQAMVIAAIFEFLGAMTLGGQVTSTIKSGIVSKDEFKTQPDILMLLMFSALISTTFWLFIATFSELPVSTTHSIVGAILGAGLCVPDVPILWSEIGKIVGSWFLAPVLCGTASALFFFIIRFTILRSDNAFNRCLLAFPIIVFVTVSINVWFIIIKGGKSYKWSETLGGDGASLGVACAVGAGIALIVQFTLVPYMRRTITASIEEGTKSAPVPDDDSSDGEQQDVVKGSAVEFEIEDVENIAQQQKPTVASEVKGSTVSQSKSFVKKWTTGRDEDLHEVRNKTVQAIHDSAERFDARAEAAFSYIQVFTACAVAFAHGANDVANAIGPLAAIVQLYDSNGKVSSKSATPTWILALGGAGIVVGLFAYGHKIIRALGVKMIKITPARGSCIELATAFVIVIGSIYKLPLSTTQVMVGGSLGVSILEGVRKSLNKKLFAKVFAGWVLTLIVAGLVSALFFSYSAYGPTLNRPMAYQNCLNEYGTSNPQTLTINSTVSAMAGSFATGESVLLE